MPTLKNPSIQLFGNPHGIAQAAADLVIDLVRLSASHRENFHWVLSGGSTPMMMFALLAQPEVRQRVPWSRVHVWWGDERCVPPADAESNYGQAYEALLRHVPIPPENIHRAKGELAPAAACADYLDQLQAAGTPYFDLVMLGLGNDGHTASLFPGQVNPLEQTQRIIAVTADYAGRPANRVTLTPLAFNASKRVVFLVAGGGKSQAVFDTVRGAHNPLAHPAQRIAPEYGGITWMLDDAAGMMLRV